MICQTNMSENVVSVINQEPTILNQEPTILQRRIICQARRGLKELDFYIDFYVKNYYLAADAEEQATFERLLSYEDPDLLLYFLGQACCPDASVMTLIGKMKAYQCT